MFRGILWFSRGWLISFVSSSLLFAYTENRVFIYFFSHPPSLLTARAICPYETVFGCTVLNPGDNQNEAVIVP